MHIAIKLDELGEQHQRSFQPLNSERELFHSFHHPSCTSKRSQDRTAVDESHSLREVKVQTDGVEELDRISVPGHVVRPPYHLN